MEDVGDPPTKTHLYYLPPLLPHSLAPTLLWQPLFPHSEGGVPHSEGGVSHSEGGVPHSSLNLLGARVRGVS